MTKKKFEKFKNFNFKSFFQVKKKICTEKLCLNKTYTIEFYDFFL